jgi:hypothetical protein
MKTIQYTFVLVGGCCFILLAIFELFLVLHLFQENTTSTQTQVSSGVLPAPPATTPSFTSVNLFTSMGVATTAPLPTPMPSRTPVALPTKSVTPAPVILAAATPVVRIATANRKSEIYSGPGTDSTIIGSVAASQSLTIIVSSADGNWYQLADGGWIGAYIVDSRLSTDLAQTSTITAAQRAEMPASPYPVSPNTPISIAASPPVAALVPTSPIVPIYTPVQAIGLTYQQACVVDESRMTDPQIAAFANQFTGQMFTDWLVWVYDVEDRGGDRYDLSLSMEERRFLWSRDILIENIPQDLALALDVEQQLILSGRIVRNETVEGLCSPLVVDSYVLRKPQNIEPMLALSSIAVPLLTPTATPAKALPLTAAPSQQWSIGQDVMVGDVRWKILSAENLNNLLEGDNRFLETKSTSGKFIRVNFEMENRGTELLRYTGMKLIDRQGRSFVGYNVGYAYVSGNKRCTQIENLKPNLPMLCTIIFEVAADATGLRAHVGDLVIFSNDEALIELGL